jgi:hypothetical protein
MKPSIESINELMKRLRELHKKYPAIVPGVRKLPSGILSGLDGRILRMWVDDPSQNMQTDGAAFESWAVAYKQWLQVEDCIDYVEMDFLRPEKISSEYCADSARGHYNRFLFRAHGFQDLFGEWFLLVGTAQNEVDRFMAWFRDEKMFMNIPNRPPKKEAEITHMERKVETWYVSGAGKPILCEAYELDPVRVFNQLPVGVFHEKVKKDTSVFTRGASAIDFWGIGADGATLNLFELKYGKNKKLGIISELLFYAQVFHELRTNPNFNSDWVAAKGKTDPRGVGILVGSGWSKLRVHFLAMEFHTYFNEALCETIDKALAKWDASCDRRTYHYPEGTID